MPKKPTIMKFGGTSVADTAAFERVARIVAGQSHQHPVVLVSAMSKVTDALVASVETAASGDVNSAISGIDEHFARHLKVARSLLAKADATEFETTITERRGELRSLLQKLEYQQANRAALTDEVLSLGEQLSAILLAHVLQAFGLPSRYVDARRVIVTDGEHGCAKPLMLQTEGQARRIVSGLINEKRIPVMGGFVGASTRGETTTLGRGGSDYSAAIVGAAVGAREIQIWTDVCGVLTADPRLVPEARTIPLLSYQEAAELAYFGARVLHPKTLQPAIDKCIPVRVCNSAQPQQAGTLIVSDCSASPPTIKAIAHKTGITTVQVTSARMLGAYGFLRGLFEVFDRHRMPVDVVTTSEVSVSLSLDSNGSLADIISDLEVYGKVEVEERRAIISIIGDGSRNTAGIAARVFSAISHINVAMISVGASSVNLTFMVDECHAGEAIQRLHQECFENEVRATSRKPVKLLAREVAA